MSNTMLPQHLQLDSTSSSSNPYLIDQLQFMQHQETSPHYQISNTNNARNDNDSSYLPSWATVTSADRRTMTAWSYDIVDACSIPREIAVIGSAYFDRFLSSPSPRAKAALVSRREFQLAFITCLIVALKCRAGMQVDSDFVSDTICQKLYGEGEIIDMEGAILKGLEWRLNGPSAHEFMGGLLELLPPGVVTKANGSLPEKLKAAAAKRVETCVLDYKLARRPPSLLAYAALLTAMQDVGASAFHPMDRLAWMRNISLVTGMKANDLSCRVLRDRMDEATRPVVVSANVVNSVPNGDDRDRVMMCTTSPDQPRGQ